MRLVKLLLIIATILVMPFIIAWALTNQKGN
jgi:hypothetical protein